MKTTNVMLLTAIAATLAAAPVVSQEARERASAPSGGMLRTLQHGTYQCALPGDADGFAYRVVEEENFRIFTASRYENGEGSGTYILRGQELTFTKGPKKGEQFEQIGPNQLRKLADDKSRTDLLCTRRGSR